MVTEISNAEIYRMVSTVNERTAKMQSDMNDVKVNQAKVDSIMESLREDSKKVNKTIYGNGGAGLIARVGRLEDKDVVTWKDTAKELLLPLALGFLGFVLGNLS